MVVKMSEVTLPPYTITAGDNEGLPVWEVAGAAFGEAHVVSNGNARLIAHARAYDELNDRIYRETGQSLGNPYRDYRMTPRGRFDKFAGDLYEAKGETARRARVWQFEYDELLEAYPDADLDPFITPERRAQEIAAAALTRLEVAQSRASGPGNLAGSFAGGFAGAFNDPANVITAAAPLGISKTVIGAAIKEGVFNAAIESAISPSVVAWRKELGIETGAGDVAKNIGIAFAFGAGLGGGGKLTEKAFMSRVRALPESHKLRRFFVGNDLEAGQEIANELAAGNAPDPALKGAAAALRKEAEIAAVRPDGVSPVVHAEAVTRGEKALKAEEPEAILLPEPEPPKRRDQVFADNDAAPPPGRASDWHGKPVVRGSFDVMQLETNAAELQYKGGGNREGVTDALLDRKSWRDTSSGQVIVYERTDGRLEIADGHQRRGLARRLIEAGQEQEIILHGFRVREADGWTPADVRAFAAEKNIHEGSGDVLDTAAIVRERPDIVDDSYPVNSELFRQARQIARLDEDAYQMVRAKQVRANYGALISQLVPSGRQAEIMRELMEAAPESMREAEFIIREAQAAPTHVQEIATLFGVESEVVNLRRARMKLAAEVESLLRKDRLTFKRLAQEADKITEEGNVLNNEANQTRASSAGAVAALVQKLATQEGPISRRLGDLAQEIEAGNLSRAKAAEMLAGDLREVFESGGIRAILQDDGPVSAPRPRPDAPEPDDLLAAAEKEVTASGQEKGAGGMDPEAEAEAEALADFPELDIERTETMLDRFKDCKPS